MSTLRDNLNTSFGMRRPAANGDLVLAGCYQTGSVVQPFLAEFLANGSPDPSFGTAGTGVVLTSLSNGIANAMTVLANGDILTAGRIDTGGSFLAEYRANGTLDPAFNSSGIVTTNSGPWWTTLATLSNGTIVVSGGNKVAEYTATGQLLTTFGMAGIMTTGLIQIDALTTLSNGELLVTGVLSGGAVALEKITTSGSLDTSFGISGVATMSSSDTPAAISVLASGDILVTGSVYDSSTGTTEGWLTEYQADGTLATTFGNQGVAMLPLNGWGGAQDMTLLANGEVLTGGTITPSTYKTYMFLAKYQVSGTPTSYANVSQTTTYTYDVKGKLTSVSVNGNLEATYTYDDAGNRVSETIGGVTTLYLNDAQNPTDYTQPLEAKTTATGKPITTWITGDRVYGQADANGGMTYLLADGHGSTRELTNAQGTVTAAFNYDAFGEALNFNPGMAATPFLFGGDAFYDAPSGLYIHGDGTRARLGFFFIQRDTYAGDVNDPLSLHRYLYTWASPINGNDPSGHLLDVLTSTALGLGLDAAAWTVGNGATLIVTAVIAASDAEALTEDADIVGTELTVDGPLHFSEAYNGLAENAQQIVSNFAEKVGEADDGVLGGFVNADGSIDFTPFTRLGIGDHSSAQAAGIIGQDALGGFSIMVEDGQVIGYNFSSALNNESTDFLLDSGFQALLKLLLGNGGE